MKKQDLKLREVVILVEGYLASLPADFKAQTPDMRRFLVSNGVIPSAPEDIERWQDEEAGDWMRKVRRFRRSSGETHQQVANFRETLEDGTTISYWKLRGMATVEEAANDTITLKADVDKAQAILVEVYKFYRRKYGKRYQRLLPFDPPEDLSASA